MALVGLLSVPACRHYFLRRLYKFYCPIAMQIIRVVRHRNDYITAKTVYQSHIELRTAEYLIEMYLQSFSTHWAIYFILCHFFFTVVVWGSKYFLTILMIFSLLFISYASHFIKLLNTVLRFSLSLNFYIQNYKKERV